MGRSLRHRGAHRQDAGRLGAAPFLCASGDRRRVPPPDKPLERSREHGHVLRARHARRGRRRRFRYRVGGKGRFPGAHGGLRRGGQDAAGDVLRRLCGEVQGEPGGRQGDRHRHPRGTERHEGPHGADAGQGGPIPVHDAEGQRHCGCTPRGRWRGGRHRRRRGGQTGRRSRGGTAPVQLGHGKFQLPDPPDQPPPGRAREEAAGRGRRRGEGGRRHPQIRAGAARSGRGDKGEPQPLQADEGRPGPAGQHDLRMGGAAEAERGARRGRRQGIRLSHAGQHRPARRDSRGPRLPLGARNGGGRAQLRPPDGAGKGQTRRDGGGDRTQGRADRADTAIGGEVRPGVGPGGEKPLAGQRLDNRQRPGADRRRPDAGKPRPVRGRQGDDDGASGHRGGARHRPGLRAARPDRRLHRRRRCRHRYPSADLQDRGDRVRASRPGRPRRRRRLLPGRRTGAGADPDGLGRNRHTEQCLGPRRRSPT